MKINDIKTFIGNLIKAGVDTSVLIVGTMGVGKSQIFAQLTKENDMELVDLRLAQMESGDLLGIPYKSENGRTEFAAPGWWPKEGTRGVILLDELNRAPTDVRQSIFQLVLDKKLHTHKLPKGWYVYAAINPGGDMGNENYQVESLDRAMLRRFCVLTVTPDTDVWLTWAKNGGGISETVTQFVSANRKLLFSDDTIKIDVKPTPDSYRMLNDMLKHNVIPKENQMEIFTGLIGTEASAAFIKWLDTSFDKPVSGTEIIKDYSKVKDKVLKQKTDANHITIGDLCACIGDKTTIPPSELKNVVDFLMDIPKESQAGLISRLSRNAKIVIFKDPRVSKLLTDIVEA